MEPGRDGYSRQLNIVLHQIYGLENDIVEMLHRSFARRRAKETADAGKDLTCPVATVDNRCQAPHHLVEAKRLPFYIVQGGSAGRRDTRQRLADLMRYRADSSLQAHEPVAAFAPQQANGVG